MNDFESHADLIDQVVEEFTARFRRGERPSVAEYIARYPDAAEALREVLPSAAWIERLKPAAAPARLPQFSLRGLEALGDFRLVREIGRGGMGIVYEAIQQSLGRRVAVKIPPPHTLDDPRRLERFRIEARAAAQLHHTNIVPVFGLFESDGLHYYAMQFIDGLGLDRLVARLKGAAWPQADISSNGLGADVTRNFTVPGQATDDPLSTSPNSAAPGSSNVSTAYGTSEYWRRVAEIGVQAADALQYAHDHGTLHRDIKPANLLLDAQGAVWITDFGLARLRESDGLTGAGDVLGTLQYIAPEAMRGEFSPTSDIYSLGMTLYELLTLEPPYPDANPTRLLQMVAQQEPPHPRSRCPEIPRELETIVLKAAAREPAHRYRSSRQLAEDLSRFLEDRPILARRASALEKLWRWSRRNRMLAATSAVASASLLIAAVVGWWAYAVTTRSLRGEEDRRMEAEAATQRAEQNVDLSLQALEEIFAALAPPDRDSFAGGPPHLRDHGPAGLPGGPGGAGGLGGALPPNSPERAERAWLGRPPGPGDDLPGGGPDSQKQAALFQAVLSFYERFSSQNNADSKLRFQAARAARRVGDLQRRLGGSTEARVAFDKSASMFSDLAHEFPDQDKYLAEWIETELAVAASALDAGDQATARSALQHARLSGERLVARHPQDRSDLVLLALVERRLGALAAQEDRLNDAVTHFRDAIDLATRQEDGAPPGPGAAEAVALTYDALADALQKLQRDVDAATALRASTDYLSARPRSPEGSNLLADQYDRLADLTADKDAAAQLRRQAADARGPQHPPHGPLGPPGPRPGFPPPPDRRGPPPLGAPE